MRLPRRKTFWRCLRRRLVAGLTLVAYLVAAAGFPIPAGAARRTGAPAPCGNPACGCETAGQAPRRCCCARPAAARPSPPPRCPHCAQAHAEQPKPAPASCCQPQAHTASKAADTSRARETTPHACCAAHQDKPATPARPAETPRGWRWPCGVCGNCCQTLLTLWISYRAVLAPVADGGWQPAPAPRDWLAADAGPVPHLPLTPPDPPPRSVL